MTVILCSLLSELTERVSWLYQQRQWTRQELLLIVLGLSILLLFMLRRRRKVAVRTIYPEHFADRSSVIGTQLSGRRGGRRTFGDSKKSLAAHVSAKQGKPSKAGKVTKQPQKAGERSGRSQWEIVKPRQSGEASKTKVAELAAANEQLRRQVVEGKSAVKRLENKITKLTAVGQQIGQGETKSKLGDEVISPQVSDSTVANEKIRRDTEENKQAQERFEQKLAELTAANKQLQQEIAELKKAGSKRRVYTYEDEHRVVDGTKQKLCRKCGEWKAEGEFHKNASRSDGLARWCKICKTGAARRSRERRRAPNQ